MQFSSDTVNSLKKYIAEVPVTWSGRLLHALMPFRRNVVYANMQLVFSEVLTPEEIRRLALGFYSHLTSSIYENIRLRLESEQRAATRISFEGLDNIFGAVAEGKGILLLTGHFGNWEFAPITGLKNFPEYSGRFHFIRKSIGVKWLERLLFRRFFAAGLQVIPHRYAMHRVLQALEVKDAVVFVMDQAAYVSSRQAVMTTFFGQPVGTYRSLASIARSTGAPVVPVTTYRRTDGNHVMAFYPALMWQELASTQEAIRHNTQNYNTFLETAILAHPEQWLWMHRRWKPNQT